MWRLSTPQVFSKALNKCAAHVLHARQAHMELAGPVLLVGQENILLGQAGVLVEIVLQARMDLWKAKVAVIFVLSAPSQTKPAKLQ